MPGARWPELSPESRRLAIATAVSLLLMLILIWMLPAPPIEELTSVDHDDIADEVMDWLMNGLPMESSTD